MSKFPAECQKYSTANPGCERGRPKNKLPDIERCPNPECKGEGQQHFDIGENAIGILCPFCWTHGPLKPVQSVGREQATLAAILAWNRLALGQRGMVLLDDIRHGRVEGRTVEEERNWITVQASALLSQLDEGEG